MRCLDYTQAAKDKGTDCGYLDGYRLLLLEFHDGKQFEGLIQKHKTWSNVTEMDLKRISTIFPSPRGLGNVEVNRERAARRAKTKIRHTCKSAQFDTMLTLTTKDPIYDRNVMQKKVEKFIRLYRIKTGEDMPYILTLEKHDSEKTSESKRGSYHVHVAVKGRKEYKLLHLIWNHLVCAGRGYVRVSNGTKKMNPGMIASYISKYISKSISEVAANKKSYWISHNIPVPKRVVKLFKTLTEAVAWLTNFYDSKGVFWSLDRQHCWQDTELGLFWLPAG